MSCRHLTPLLALIMTLAGCFTFNSGINTAVVSVELDATSAYDTLTIDGRSLIAQVIVTGQADTTVTEGDVQMRGPGVDQGSASDAISARLTRQGEDVRFALDYIGDAPELVAFDRLALRLPANRRVTIRDQSELEVRGVEGAVTVLDAQQVSLDRVGPAQVLDSGAVELDVIDDVAVSGCEQVTARLHEAPREATFDDCRSVSVLIPRGLSVTIEVIGDDSILHVDLDGLALDTERGPVDETLVINGGSSGRVRITRSLSVSIISLEE